jgi:leucyl/phenylalanyl-tRNA---protein transferase
MNPIEPKPSGIRFPSPAAADERGLVALGGDLEPGSLLLAYRSGLFPMGLADGRLSWWSPDPRGILPLDALHVSKSLKKSARRFTTTVDKAFADVIDACADRPADEFPWITKDVREAYVTLHELGWAHSIESWSSDGDLVGGLYGVAIGGLFAGESMFSRRTDASKVALVTLVETMSDPAPSTDRLIDVQWLTPHLASLGAIEVPRAEYLRRLEPALAQTRPAAFC